jgi:hypothetical protein
LFHTVNLGVGLWDLVSTSGFGQWISMLQVLKLIQSLSELLIGKMLNNTLQITPYTKISYSEEDPTMLEILKLKIPLMVTKCSKVTKTQSSEEMNTLRTWEMNVLDPLHTASSRSISINHLTILTKQVNSSP